jgi:hypothetical protein
MGKKARAWKRRGHAVFWDRPRPRCRARCAEGGLKSALRRCRIIFPARGAVMQLSWNEIRDRALKFSREWADETSEDAEAKSFWDELMHC